LTFTIQVKRSPNNTPANLAPGEMAWSESSQTFFIGTIGGGVLPIAGLGSPLTNRANHKGTDGGAVIYAADFGAGGDLVYSKPTYNTVTRVSGTDTTSKIQDALNVAGSKVPSDVNLDYEQCITVVVPSGKYFISSPLVVPPNVILDASNAYLFNFLADPFTPVVQGSRHSHCTHISVHGNSKSGIAWGDQSAGGVRCDSRLESIYVEHAGVNYDSSRPGNQQKCGLRLSGLNFRLNRVEIKEANIGLDLYQASDVLCPSVFMIGCSTGIRLESCEQVILPLVALDTTIQTGIQIDNSNNVYMQANAFVNSDGYGTPMEYGVVVGRYSGMTNKNIVLDYIAQSTGGYALEVGKTEDCEFSIKATNSRTFSQTSGRGTANSHWNPLPSGALLAHDLGTRYFPYGNEGTPGSLIKYMEGSIGYLKIRLTRNKSIARIYEGTPYGVLLEESGLLAMDGGVF